MRSFQAPAQFSSPRRAWLLAIVVIAVQIIFCAVLVLVHAVAETAAGRRVADVLVADSAVVSARGAGSYHPTRLAGESCCNRAGAAIRTQLSAADAQLADPAILIVSVHDNALLYLNGELIGGQGRLGETPSNLGARPMLWRIPKSLATEGAHVDILVQRIVGVAHIRPFYIGEYRALYPSYLALGVLRVDLLFVNAAFGAFLAGFCLCAAPLFGGRALLFSLAGLGASWTLQHVGLLLSDPPWGVVANSGLYYVAFLGTLTCAVWFFVQWTSVFAEHAAPRRVGWRRVLAGLIDPWTEGPRRALAWAALGAIAIATVFVSQRLTHDLETAAHDVNVGISWFGLFAMAFCLVRIVAFYLRDGLRHPIEAFAFIFVIVAALADLVLVRFFNGTGVFLGAAVTLFPVALLVSLAARARGVFEAATTNARQLNLLVAAREGEIRDSFVELQKRERASMLLEERTRIMRDMHDGIGGQLLGLILRARSKQLGSEALVSGLEESLSDLRLVVDSLEQPEGSLSNALGAFRARIEPRCEAANVDLDWRIGDAGPTPQIGPDKILQIYRILQEACTNALTHGRAKSIIVSLRRTAPDKVEISLADDGVGFDPNVASRGRGIANMRFRAQRMGAEMSLRSGGDGTRVALEIEA